jgi:hypothetical protein
LYLAGVDLLGGAVAGEDTKFGPARAWAWPSGVVAVIVKSREPPACTVVGKEALKLGL